MHPNAPSCALALILALSLAGCGPGPTPESAGPVSPVDRARDQELERAIALLKSKEAEGAFEALQALEAWLAAHVDAPARALADAHRWAAHACAHLSMPEEGLQHADAGIALAPRDPWLHYARGVALHPMGELELALSAFTRALELDPTHAKAAQWRGYTRHLLRQPAEAVLDYDRALSLLESWTDADYVIAEVLRWRADAHDALGQHDAASADREAARTLTQ